MKNRATITTLINTDEVALFLEKAPALSMNISDVVEYDETSSFITIHYDNMGDLVRLGGLVGFSKALIK